METRNRLGVQPLQKYLDAIDNAKTIEEFTTAETMIRKEISSGGSVSVMLMNDYRDNKQKIIKIQSMIPSYSQEEYQDTENRYINAQKTMYRKYLILAGESEEEAAKKAEAPFILEQKLLPAMPPSEDFSDPNKINKAVSVEELQKLLPAIDIKALIEATGFEATGDVVLNSPDLIEAYGKLMTDENLDLFKAASKVSLLEAHFLNLSQDFMDVYDEYNQAATGSPADINTAEETAAGLVTETLGDYIDQLYVEKHFSPEAKKDVEKMVQGFLDNYKTRIQNLDWMGDKTKQRALEKLE